ncbi:hypothetical protein CWE02_09185 [Brucella pituitosa]|nr:hypothetical protein CWE02_09185 [Brucella pituitosa]
MKSGTLVNSMTAFYFDMLMAFGNTGQNCGIGVEIISRRLCIRCVAVINPISRRRSFAIGQSGGWATKVKRRVRIFLQQKKIGTFSG